MVWMVLLSTPLAAGLLPYREVPLGFDPSRREKAQGLLCLFHGRNGMRYLSVCLYAISGVQGLPLPLSYPIYRLFYGAILIRCVPQGQLVEQEATQMLGLSRRELQRLKGQSRNPVCKILPFLLVMNIDALPKNFLTPVSQVRDQESSLTKVCAFCGVRFSRSS